MPAASASAAEAPQTLQQVIDSVLRAGRGESVAVSDMVEAVGRRSFGPVLLVPSLIIVSPISGIPGVPTVGGLTLAFIASQILLDRDRIWLPRFLLKRRLSRRKLERAMGAIRPAAVMMDNLIRPRLTFLTRKPFSYMIAGLCVMIALAMPPLELIPFASSFAAGAIALFALALLARDGVVVLGGLVIALVALVTGLGILL
jgi:hypothetical protein